MKRIIRLAALTMGLLASPTAILSQSNISQQVFLSSVTPSSIVQGATNLQLVVRGSGFTSKSQIRLNGEHRQTSFVSSGEIRAALLPLDVASPRTSKVAVFTPSAGTTRELALTVTAPVVAPPAPAPTMSISGLEPASAIPGAKGGTMGVRGAAFTSSMIIRWNGANRATTFLVNSLLTAFVGSGDIATAGTANVTVYDPATGAETPAIVFHVDPSKGGVPRITALGRNTAVAGTAFSTAVNGDGFIFGSIVRVNGVPLPLNQISYNGMRIIGMQVTAEMIATPGTYRITVFNPGPNGGESNAVQLTVASP
jgi:hypothetical protein